LESSQDDEEYIPEAYKDVTKQTQMSSSARIREDQDVLDFLDSKAVSKITSAPKQKKKNIEKTPDFKTSADGRMLVAESDSELEVEPDLMQTDYYRESLRGEGAFTRAADGKIKFLDKKRRRDDEEDEDREGKSAKTGKDWRRKNSEKKAPESSKDSTDRMLGRQYKSAKAGGDVKRVGMADPHAYIPLSGKIVGNMKKSAKLTGSFKNIIKAAKKGADVKSNTKPRNFKQMKKGNKRHH
jgi:ribosomal RNA-processing protein 12